MSGIDLGYATMRCPVLTSGMPLPGDSRVLCAREEERRGGERGEGGGQEAERSVAVCLLCSARYCPRLCCYAMS
eukprot:762388-Rhodomonas_salina.1